VTHPRVVNPCAANFPRYSIAMDMEQVLQQLQDTAAVLASIPAAPADLLKDPTRGLRRRPRLVDNHRRMARNARLMAEIERMLNSLNRKPE
jgi:hypothetical protein